MRDDWMNNLGTWEEDWSKAAPERGTASCARARDDEDIA